MRRTRIGAGLAVAGLGALAGVILAGRGAMPVPLTSLAAASPTGSAAADQAAITYADSHYAGAGTARVLKTEPDVDRGVPVYDVRLLAPDGTTYVVHVQRSNDAVLWANRAESQTTPPATSPSPPAPAPASPAAEPSGGDDSRGSASGDAHDRADAHTSAGGQDSPDHGSSKDSSSPSGDG